MRKQIYLIGLSVSLISSKRRGKWFLTAELTMWMKKPDWGAVPLLPPPPPHSWIGWHLYFSPIFGASLICQTLLLRILFFRVFIRRCCHIGHFQTQILARKSEQPLDSKQRPAGQEEEIVHPVGRGCLVHRAPHKLALLKTRMMIMQIVRKFVMVVLTIEYEMTPTILTTCRT